MKKRRYSSTHVKSVRPDDLRERVRGKELVVAVDVAKRKQFAALGTSEARDGIRTVSFDLKEAHELVELVRHLEPSRVVVVLEPSGTYGDPLRQSFEDAGWEVRQVGGKKTRDARELYDSVPSSHDPKSCHLLLRLHFEGLSQAMKARTSQDRELAAAVSTMKRRQQACTVLTGQLEGMLARYWPEVTGLLDLNRASLHALLEAFPGPEAVAGRDKAAKQVLKRVGGSFLSKEKIEQVIASARSSLGVRMAEGEREALVELARDVSRAHWKHKQAKRRVESFASQIRGAETLSEVVGKATAVVLVSELGYAEAYASAAAYEKAFGLNLKETSSGGQRGMPHITKRGSSTARQALFFVVLRLVQTDEVVKAWYGAKRKRDGKNSAHKAIVAVMRKVSRALWHVGQGVRFDSRKLFDASRLGLRSSSLPVEEVLCEAREATAVMT